MRIEIAAGAALCVLALATPAHAQKKVNHVAELNASDKAVALHAHELSHISKPGLTKAKAAPHVAAMSKALDEANAHLAAVEKEPATGPQKLAISEIRKDHEGARKHLGEVQSELDKKKIDPAAVKHHVGAVDSAIDDAVDLEAKLPGAPKQVAGKH